MKRLYIFLLCLFSFATAFSQFPITQGLGAPNTLVKARNGLGVDSGFVYVNSFADTATANLGYLKNIPGITIRTVNTLWIRDNTAQYWIEFGAGSLHVDTTETIRLEGDGSADNPLAAHLAISQQSGNILDTLPDGVYVPSSVQNGLRTGGIVTWEVDYTYTVSPATYAINNVSYASPETEITLDNVTPPDRDWETV